MNQKFEGVLDASNLRKIITGEKPMITSSYTQGINIDEGGAVQPSSLDLTLTGHFYGMGRMRLPERDQPVSDLCKQYQYEFSIRQMEEGFLHKGYTYIAQLHESVEFPKGYSAKFSPKSSIGRIDVFVRVLADGVPLYDRLPDGYKGHLYLEITPLSFPIKLGPHESLTQMRIKVGDPNVSGEELPILQSAHGIFLRNGKSLQAHELEISSRGAYMHIDLDRDIVGFVSRTSSPPISFKGIGTHDWQDYWEPIPRPRNRSLIIEPGRFYLPATKEGVRIPDFLCGDILEYDTSVGEMRTHYAGFFDPGFGAEKTGTIGVLEVRGREAAYELVDGQPICVMAFERLVPGATAKYSGNYKDPRPSLSKFFTERYEAWEIK